MLGFVTAVTYSQYLPKELLTEYVDDTARRRIVFLSAKYAKIKL
jgi:hypothetical protein